MISVEDLSHEDLQRAERICARLARLGLLIGARALTRGVGVPLEVAVSRLRDKTVMRARRELYRWLRGHDYSYPRVGAILEVDHTTVMSGVGAIVRARKPRPGGPLCVAPRCAVSCAT